MTPLRQRMLDALVLRGMALRTQEAYIAAVAGLARYYRRSPDTLTADEVRGYLLHLLRERKLSRSSVNQYGSACRFFYGSVLGLDGNAFQIPLARAPQRLPEILSRDEIARLFAVARHPKSRSFFMLAYGTGLRLSELCHLRVADIDSHADRMCIRVVQGKGAKDRYVPLAPDVLEHLRAWWQLARCRDWLFCTTRDGAQPLEASSVQRWYRAACAHAGITKQGGIHTLRCHLHVHALMACGALQLARGGDGAWVRPKRSPNFLFPVHALSKVFRGKFMQALQDAEQDGTLARDPASSATARRQRVQALRRHDWVVYAKTPLSGPGAVLDYLSRYTHRTAIGNERLVTIAGDKLLLRVRANDRGGKRVITMPGEQFIARLLQHVLPPGFKRIRHYGLLAPAAKTERLATARKLLAMPAANPQAREDAKGFMRRVAAIEIERCPHCRLGHWCVVERRGADRAAIAALLAAPTPAMCRGPP